MSEPVYGKTMNYRIGIRTQKSHECLIEFTSVTTKSRSGQLVGRKVVLTRAKKKYTGKIVGARAHPREEWRSQSPIPEGSFRTSLRRIGRTSCPTPRTQD